MNSLNFGHARHRLAGSIFASLILHDKSWLDLEGDGGCFKRTIDWVASPGRVVQCCEELDDIFCRRMAHQESIPKPTKPPRVLLIDDNSEDRSYWSASLKKPPIGFVVLDAACGESGFKLWQKERVDCVLLDLEMPESGLFTLVRLIPDPTHRHVPVVVLTKLAQPSLIKLMKSLGAYECLVKDYCSPERLANTIQQAIAVIKSERAV